MLQQAADIPAYRALDRREVPRADYRRTRRKDALNLTPSNSPRSRWVDANVLYGAWHARYLAASRGPGPDGHISIPNGSTSRAATKDDGSALSHHCDRPTLDSYRHVVAAAVRGCQCDCDAQNLRDFPRSRPVPHQAASIRTSSSPNRSSRRARGPRSSRELRNPPRRTSQGAASTPPSTPELQGDLAASRQSGCCGVCASASCGGQPPTRRFPAVGPRFLQPGRRTRLASGWRSPFRPRQERQSIRPVRTASGSGRLGRDRQRPSR